MQFRIRWLPIGFEYLRLFASGSRIAIERSEIETEIEKERERKRERERAENGEEKTRFSETEFRSAHNTTVAGANDLELLASDETHGRCTLT